jgi:integrase/recombinase XerD
LLLAALRMLFDWLVVGHVLDNNPAHAVRGPKYLQKKGKMPVLDREEARALIAAIDTSSLTGLRNRALIVREHTKGECTTRCR